jgi:hypothetical protein
METNLLGCVCYAELRLQLDAVLLSSHLYAWRSFGLIGSRYYLNGLGGKSQKVHQVVQVHTHSR